MDHELMFGFVLVGQMYAGRRTEMTEPEYQNLMQNLFESSEKDATKLFQAGGKNKTSISFSKQ